MWKRQAMNPNDVLIFQRSDLPNTATQGMTSPVCEPNVLNNGEDVLFTGNWFAARSLDDTQSWTYMSPFNFFPSVNNGFCCDQTVIYDPSRDISIWLLQYLKDDKTNTLRIAVKQGQTLGDDQWEYWDFSPEDIDSSWKKEWFDFNHVTLSDNFLYATTNVFDLDGQFSKRCVVLRIPLDDLTGSESVSVNAFSTIYGSVRCVQGARDTMYFAAHAGGGTSIKLWRWKESETSVGSVDLDVTKWRGGKYSAPVAGSPNWMNRMDGRITAGWVGRGVIGFMWTANSQNTTASNPSDRRLFPFIRVVRISESDLELIDEPDIWSSKAAFAWPNTSANQRGDVGVSCFVGGGTEHPSHLVGGYDSEAPSKWRLVLARKGTDSPNSGAWGDYLCCNNRSPDGLTWIAAAYTLQGGGDDGNIVPHYVHFGQRRYSTPRRNTNNTA